MSDLQLCNELVITTGKQSRILNPFLTWNILITYTYSVILLKETQHYQLDMVISVSVLCLLLCSVGLAQRLPGIPPIRAPVRQRPGLGFLPGPLLGPLTGPPSGLGAGPGMYPDGI